MSILCTETAYSSTQSSQRSIAWTRWGYGAIWKRPSRSTTETVSSRPKICLICAVKYKYKFYFYYFNIYVLKSYPGKLKNNYVLSLLQPIAEYIQYSNTFEVRRRSSPVGRVHAYPTGGRGFNPRCKKEFYRNVNVFSTSELLMLGSLHLSSA